MERLSNRPVLSIRPYENTIHFRKDFIERYQEPLVNS